MFTQSPTMQVPTAAPQLLDKGERSIPVAVQTDPTSGEPAPGTLMLWRRIPQYAEFGRSMVSIEPPTLVLNGFQASASSGTIDLRSFLFAYQAAAVAFGPGAGYTSVTLAETSDSSGPTYTLTTSGLFDLYSIGWAARTGAVTFNT